MQDHRPTRRDFNQLTLAAFGGALAGAVAGCSSEAPKGAAVVPPVNPDGVPDSGDTPVAADDGPDLTLLLAEKHVCRGLNTCKGKGGCGATKGANECAGQGNCATVEHHDCGSAHDCKGQSGCGDTAGVNACKGQGSCAVPLHDGGWEVARGRLEELLKAEGKTLGAAPAKAE